MTITNIEIYSTTLIKIVTDEQIYRMDICNTVGLDMLLIWARRMGFNPEPFDDLNDLVQTMVAACPFVVEKQKGMQ